MAEGTDQQNDFEHICRMCLTNDKNMSDIFLLAAKVEFVTRLGVYFGDGLPTFICERCVSELNSANVFITRCVENDSLLRSKLNSVYTPDDSIIIKEENIEDITGPAINYQDIYYEDNDNQCIIDNNRDFAIAHSPVVQIHSSPDSEPATDFFRIVEIFQPSASVFSTDADEDLVSVEPIQEPHTKVNHVQMYTCDLCDESFNMKMYFNRHVKSHATDVYTKSGIRARVNGTEGTSKREEASVVVNYFTCRFCSRRFLREKSLQKHEQTHVAKRTFDCWRCQKKFQDEFRLKLHAQKYHRAPKPSVTNRRVPVKKEVGRKAKVLAIGPPVTTKERPKRTPTKKSPVTTDSPSTSASSKKIAKPKKHQAPTFRCPTCNKTLATKRAMLAHASRHNKKPGPATFPCSSCIKVFRTERARWTHARIHGKRSHECKECGKHFTKKASLKQHATSHAEPGLFKCGKCGEEFGSRLHLKHHKRFHADEKPYKCSECALGFVDEVSLLCHFAVHANKRVDVKEEGDSTKPVEESDSTKPVDKPKPSVASCDVCGRDFASKGAFAMHMKKHASLKCSKCGEEFETKKLLAEHVPIHDEDNPYRCTNCGSECSDEAAMLEHFKSHMKVEIM